MDNPVAAITLVPADSPTHLDLEVTDVVNPREQAVSIEVRLDLGGDEGSRHVGAAALFPPDRGGRFRLPLPGELQRTLDDRREPVEAILRLSGADDPGEVPHSVRLTVTAAFFSRPRS